MWIYYDLTRRKIENHRKSRARDVFDFILNEIEFATVESHSMHCARLSGEIRTRRSRIKVK